MRSKFDCVPDIIHDRCGNAIRDNFLQKQINDEVAANVDFNEDSNVLSLRSKTGEVLSSVTLPNAQQGPEGPQGPDGTTFTPQVSSDGILSWTNDGGKENPESVNVVSAVIAQLPIYTGEGD